MVVERIGERIEDMGKSASLPGTWVVIASALSVVLTGGSAINGNGVAISRVGVGTFRPRGVRAVLERS